MVFSELCLTAAALLGLYLVYQYWFTNEVASIQSAAISDELVHTFEAQTDSVAKPVKPEPVQLVTTPLESLGMVYIPRLRADVWGTPIIVGVEERALAHGVGYYPGAALPGEPGNFALAAHRATHGEPFARFEKLKAGDLVHIQTTTGWFSYELVQNRKIRDSETWVLDASPKGIALGSDRIITLTTCDPRWNSVRRWAWWGVLVDTSSEAPAEIEAPNDL